MYIEVARIPEQGLDLAGTDDQVLKAKGERGFEALGPLKYDFHINYVSGELIVFGSIGVRIKFPCSKCAVPFENEVLEPRFACAIECPEGNESVDLTGEIREAILCAFPSHPVCRKDCKGLCAQCGRDLNEGECECVPGNDSRWQALGDLKLK